MFIIVFEFLKQFGKVVYGNTYE